MNKLLEQFKYLNPKDPGTWPALPKLKWLTAPARDGVGEAVGA